MGERILISTRRLVGYFTKIYIYIFDQQLIIVTPQLRQHIISMPWPLLIGNTTWFLLLSIKPCHHVKFEDCPLGKLGLQ